MNDNLINLSISGLKIGINAPKWVLHENFEPFICSIGTNTDISFEIIFDQPELDWKSEANPLLEHSSVSFYDHDGITYLINNSRKGILFCAAAYRKWTSYTMFIDPFYNKPSDHSIVNTVRNDVFSAIQRLISPALAYKMSLMIHSSTIIWNSSGIMFAASSGTGKTTHTNIWKRLFGVEILDGDITACRIVDGKVLAYGLPWCGTSGEYSNRCVPLGAIVFLQQASENSIKKLDTQEAFLRLSSQSFILPLKVEIMDIYMDIIKTIVECTDCYHLNCLPNEEAVELVKQTLQQKDRKKTKDC